MYQHALSSSKVLVLAIGSHVAQALLEFDSQVRGLPVHTIMPGFGSPKINFRINACS